MSESGVSDQQFNLGPVDLRDGQHIETIKPVKRGRASNGKFGGAKGFLAFVLACVIIFAVVVLANKLSPSYSSAVVFALGIGAIIGLTGVVAFLFGFIQLGKMPKQRIFFENLIDGLDGGCFVTDRKGLVVFSNQYYRDLLSNVGQTRMVGFENLYAGHYDLSDKIYRLAQAARENKSHLEEIRLGAGQNAAGADQKKAVWLELSVKPLSTNAGTLSKSYSLWRLRDVSETRVTQETAFSNLQYIINYLDHAPAGFFSTKPDGEVVYTNATLAGWLGLDIGRQGQQQIKLSDILSKEDAQLLLDAKPGLSEVRTEVFDVDLVHAGQSSDGELNKAGNDVPFPVRIIHRADFDSNGVAQPSRSLVLDLREYSRGREGDSQKLTRLMNNAPFAIAELDHNNVVIQSNAMFAKLGNLATRGAQLTDLVTQEGAEVLGNVLKELHCGEVASKAVAVTFKGHEERTANIVLARHTFDQVGDDRRGVDRAANLQNLSQEEDGSDSFDNETGYVFVYVVDTSEHSLLEEQLAQSQKMQAVGQLAGGVAHDFNNVLTAIIGFSDLLLAKHRPTDPSFADIMNIKQNANRAANLVRQLLAFSRRQTLRTQVISLSDVMSDLGNLLSRLLGEKIDLEMVYGRDLWYVNVDMNQFEQVVINLAVNARDAMEMKGALTIRTSNVSAEESRLVAPDIMPEGEYVLCEVIDTGTGMPPEIIAKIYEPFFSTKEVGKGTGLGLSTVYGIVKQTGGFIFCESEIGQGTTFKIYLPRVKAPVEEDVQDAEKVDVKKADMTGDARILLVEDEDAVRAFASRALATRGFEVLEADSGESALEIIDDGEEFDLVLSDVVMPEMDGPTMLKEIRKRGIKTKFIFISGYAEDAFEKNLEGADDFAFLPKPFSLKQLTEAVKDALQS